MIKGTEHLCIGDLVAQRKPFFVPIYQRSYAWEAEEIDDFINDLRVIHQTQLSEPTAQTGHFFGGLVSVDQFAPHTRTGHRYEIVDGQQRLATFIITIGHIVSALEYLASRAREERDIDAESAASAHAKHTRANFLQYEEVEDDELRQRLRLRLSKADHFFFENLILRRPAHASRESHNRLQNAFNKIENKLISPILKCKNCSINEKLDLLLALTSCVTDSCNVIHIVSDDRNEAYRLFRVLNDRGRTLSDGDKLRSHTLELLEDYQESQEEVEGYWNNILSDTPANIDQYLRSYYPSHVGERAPKRGLFDYFRERFFDFPTIPIPDSSDSLEVVRRVADIGLEFEVFSRIVDGEWPYDAPSVSVWDRERLYRLIKVLRHTLCIPLLLAAYRQMDEQSFSELVNLLERFVFRYITVVRVHPGSLGDCYYRNSVEIRTDKTRNHQRELERDLHKLALSGAPDDLFKINLSEKLSYSQQSQRRIIKHFLTTIEDHYRWFVKGAAGKPQPDRTASYDINHVTIEHIYARNPIKPDVDIDHLKDEIGNLAFWAPNENAAAGNDSFDEKRSRYAESKIRLTRELADVPCWDRQAVIERKESLIRMACRIFAI